MKRFVVLMAIVATVLAIPMAVPALGSAADNPFVGSWESIDPDTSHVRLQIAATGNWHLRDDAGTICLDDYGFVPATARGTGDFDGDVYIDVFNASGADVYCYPRDGSGRQFVEPTAPNGFAYWPDLGVMVDQYGVCWWRTGTGDQSNCPSE